MIMKTEQISKKMLRFIAVVAFIVFTAGAAAQEEENVSVRVNAPEFVSGTFDITIDVRDVIDLNSGQFDLSFDPDVVNVNDVYEGMIDGTTVPIDMWLLVGENRARVLFKLPETGLVSGSGYLTTIACEVVGNDGDASDLEVSNGELFSYTSNDNPILGGNTEHKEINADWSGDVVTVGNADVVGAAATASTPVQTATPRSSPSSLDLGVGLVTASTPTTGHTSDAAVPVETSGADEPGGWGMLVKHNFIGTYLFIGLLAFAYTLMLLR
ncbi:MAG: cohesin domain-containing protein [Euryarchaeota archaeon]|nr:cohesin domain-containing protein [Euryarchaeota archaeon]